jgi:hypothetical protein
MLSVLREPDCGSGGRWFESTQLYQRNQQLSFSASSWQNRRVRTVSVITMQVEQFRVRETTPLKIRDAPLAKCLNRPSANAGRSAYTSRHGGLLGSRSFRSMGAWPKIPITAGDASPFFTPS